MSAKGTAQNSELHFKCIFDTYKQRVYAYVLVISHSPYSAEEITQEIFVKLWICRDILPGIDNIDSYLFTIAKNHSLNFLRNAARQQGLLRELQQSMITSSDAVNEHSNQHELDRLVQEAIQQLSTQRRVVYELSRNQGMDHQQIALQLQLSKNTVKNHLVSALQFIRKQVTAQKGSILLPMLFFYFFC